MRTSSERAKKHTASTDNTRLLKFAESSQPVEKDQSTIAVISEYGQTSWVVQLGLHPVTLPSRPQTAFDPSASAAVHDS